MSDFCNRKALKGLGVGVALAAFSQCTANFTITCYAAIVFKKIGSSMDPNVASVMLALALIFGSLATGFFCDRLGRKVLNLISFVGSFVGLFIAAAFYYVNLQYVDLSMYQWVPVASLSLVVFISSAGIIPLVFICTVEYMPPKVFTYASMFIQFDSLSLLNCFIFIFLSDSDFWFYNSIDLALYNSRNIRKSISDSIGNL